MTRLGRCALLLTTCWAGLASATPTSKPQRLVKNGVRVELSVGLAGGGKSSVPLMEGDFAEVKFKLTDATSGQPLRGLSPSAWLDIAGKDQAQSCRDKVGLYLKGLVGVRPMLDLNSYHLLVLNQDPTISVIDPIVGVSGKTSLFASVVLQKPGADWAKSRDERTLFVSMPRANAVAVVDTDSFKVKANIAAGEQPARVALQPDGRYLWVGNDTDDVRSGVTVIDTESLKRVATIPTGRGHHEIAFTLDDHHAFVSNRGAGTVSVIDIAKLKVVKEIPTGPVPISVALSSLSRLLYVADGQEGTITAIDGSSLAVLTRFAAKPGLGPMRFSQDGRWGVVVNTTEHAVHVIDAASNRLTHTITVNGAPYQVSFTRGFAYVRLLDSERVEMINLSSLERGGTPLVSHFLTGTIAPKAAGDLSLAESVTPAATEAAVFAVNPADNTTYFYMEGMNAPMGTFGNYGHNARAATVVDRSIRELSPGVYSAKVRIPTAAKYDVAFLLDSPRLVHCFGFESQPNPKLKHDLKPVEVEYVGFPTSVTAGEPTKLRFKLVDPSNRAPQLGLSDVTVIHYRAPRFGRTETTAREVGEGVYEVTATLTETGAYYVHLAVPSLKVSSTDLPYRALQVRARKK